jgi:hypothetical protein
MKHALLVLAAFLALTISAPASAQYMYIDVNGDGLNTSADVLTPSVTGVDIYLATNKALSDPSDPSSPIIDATCQTDVAELTINSYQMILTTPSGGVTYGAWTDNMGFVIDLGNMTAGNDDVIGWATPTPLPAGTYKLGHLAITVIGNPILTFAVTTSLSDQVFTAFGSQCGGHDFDNTMKYNTDWQSIGPTWIPIPVTETTWGKIKNLYR